MPWTFSHPAAILPFKRLCPRFLNLAGLFMGALAPDVGYYIDARDLSDSAHTLLGSLTICVPTGCLLVAAFYLLRRPLWWLLPQPHRGALQPLVFSERQWTPLFVLSIAASIVIGIWTHIAWDSFTHRGRWASGYFHGLAEPWLHFGATPIRGYTVLQHLSTIAGMTIMAFAYWRWLAARSAKAVDDGRDRWRYAGILAALAVSLAVSIPAAIHGAARFSSPYTSAVVFVVRTVVYATCVLTALTLLYAGIYFWIRRNRR